MDEARLIDKLRLIEALFSGATTEGEKVAAERARDRILERLKLWEKEDPPVEYRFSMADMWSRKVFVALLRRYGIRPYRYSGQRYTTVMARVSKRFVDETLWPEFQEFSETLSSYLSDVTDRVVQQAIHQDSSEAEVVEKPKQLPLGVAQPDLVQPTAPATNPKPDQQPKPSGHAGADPEKPEQEQAKEEEAQAPLTANRSLGWPRRRNQTRKCRRGSTPASATGYPTPRFRWRASWV